jgi:hypothetical protein
MGRELRNGAGKTGMGEKWVGLEAEVETGTEAEFGARGQTVMKPPWIANPACGGRGRL